MAWSAAGATYITACKRSIPQYGGPEHALVGVFVRSAARPQATPSRRTSPIPSAAASSAMNVTCPPTKGALAPICSRGRFHSLTAPTQIHSAKPRRPGCGRASLSPPAGRSAGRRRAAPERRCAPGAVLSRPVDRHEQRARLLTAVDEDSQVAARRAASRRWPTRPAPAPSVPHRQGGSRRTARRCDRVAG